MRREPYRGTRLEDQLLHWVRLLHPRSFEVFYRVIDRDGAVRMEYLTNEEMPKSVRDDAASEILRLYKSGRCLVIAYSAGAPEGEMGVAPRKDLEFISEDEFRRIEADGWRQFADLD